MNFLPDVETDIRRQGVVGSGRIPNDGQHAPSQSRVELELLAELGGHERRHRAPQRPSREQIDALPLREALLDFDSHLARLSFRIQIGADGKVRDLVLEKLAENARNPFYRGPWTRLRDRLKFLRRGYEFSNRELRDRTVHAVFNSIGDWLKPLLQLLGHLAFYLWAFSFRDRARAMGLEVSLAEVGEDGDPADTS